MEEFAAFFSQWGYFGLFFGSFIAGSVVPLSSEAILVVCLGLGLEPWGCLGAALAGNVAGGMTCYWMGSWGSQDTIQRWCHVKKEKVDKASRWVKKYGAWVALLAWIPLFGSAVTIALGLLRANVWGTVAAMTTGKFFRYYLIIYGTMLLI